jgi:hypothetical protein
MHKNRDPGYKDRDPGYENRDPGCYENRDPGYYENRDPGYTNRAHLNSGGAFMIRLQTAAGKEDATVGGKLVQVGGKPGLGGNFFERLLPAFGAKYTAQRNAKMCANSLNGQNNGGKDVNMCTNSPICGQINGGKDHEFCLSRNGTMSYNASRVCDHVTVRDSDSDSCFKFLSIFKFEDRKGWDVLLQAYWREFGAQDNVSLCPSSCVCLYMYMKTIAFEHAFQC